MKWMLLSTSGIALILALVAPRIVTACDTAFQAIDVQHLTSPGAIG